VSVVRHSETNRDAMRQGDVGPTRARRSPATYSKCGVSAADHAIQRDDRVEAASLAAAASATTGELKCAPAPTSPSTLLSAIPPRRNASRAPSWQLGRDVFMKRLRDDRSRRAAGGWRCAQRVELCVARISGVRK